MKKSHFVSGTSLLTKYFILEFVYTIFNNFNLMGGPQSAISCMIVVFSRYSPGCCQEILGIPGGR